MGQRREWIPPSAPLSEEYWRALLRDGEGGSAAPTASQADIWEDRTPSAEETHAQSADSIDVEDTWAKAQNLMAQGEVMELPVVGHNRGGLLVGWNGLQGFVPASHLLDLPPSTDEEERQKELRHYVGSRLSLKIIELDPDNSRFVLSERATQVEHKESADLLRELEPGDVRKGRVTNLCSFGAFVDLGGFEGLVHISELSWGRVGHPSDVLAPGQDVDVYVLNVEPERERVGLSIKRLQPNPWQSVEERYSVGDTVEGTVTHVVDFGAFVQLEEGLEGLIHVSELESGRSCDPHDVLDPNDVVTVEVLSIDSSRRRMGLRLEHAQSGASPSPDDESDAGTGPSGE
ncbi:MAG: S1 RNA-binding domain-containing protein [Anaerolineae bacterium]|jgi:small subunit ribosomal protein S1